MEHEQAMTRPAICALLYGDFHALHRRCIDSIVKNTRGDYSLHVGCNEVCRKTLDWLDHQVMPAGLHVEDRNIRKYPMMSRMFRGISEDHIIWFDDDSWAMSPKWLTALMDDARSHPDVSMFGKLYYYHVRDDMDEWAKKGSWWTGRPWEIDPRIRKPRIFFCTGGFWAISRKAVEQAGIPDPRMSNRGDIWIGGMLYQQGLKIMQTGACNHIRLSDHRRRGANEAIPGTRGRL